MFKIQPKNDWTAESVHPTQYNCQPQYKKQMEVFSKFLTKVRHEWLKSLFSLNLVRYQFFHLKKL